MQIELPHLDLEYFFHTSLEVEGWLGIGWVMGFGWFE
jgi:hypothetical protein